MREVHEVVNATTKAISAHERAIKELAELEVSLEETEALLVELEQEMDLFEESRVFLQELAEVTREEVASELEKVVTLCLQAVFDESLSFEIAIDTSRNNTVIEFYVVDTSGDEVLRLPPEDSMGGGIVDTCAIGLRFGVLKVLEPFPVGPIMLDEPAKMVSRDKLEAIGALIQELGELFNKQNILVTHHTTLMDIMDNCYYFEKVNGYTKVHRVSEGRLA